MVAKKIINVILLALLSMQGAFAESVEEYKDNAAVSESFDDNQGPLGGRLRFEIKGTVGKDFVSSYLGNNKIPTDPNAYYLFAGPAVSAEYLLARWFSLGAQYRGLFEVKSPEPVNFHDIAAFAKFIFPSVKNDVSDMYFKLPVGFSMITTKAQGLKSGLGFNVGGMFGGNYFFSKYVGINAEVGYEYRYISADTIAGKVTMHMHEIATGLGLVVKI